MDSMIFERRENSAASFPKKQTGKCEKMQRRIRKSSSKGKEICFKTNGREPAEGGMGTQGVEALDVGKHISLSLGAGGIVFQMDQLTVAS